MEHEESGVSTEEDQGATTNRVQVVVRVRPVLPNESVDDVAVTCSGDGTKVQVLLPDKGGNGKDMLPGASRSGARSYSFDACLPGSTTQVELFEVCGLQELVESALAGYSVTVFAFGQTGSGKTHTMIGPRLSRSPMAPAPGSSGNSPALDAEDGLLPRCLVAAYQGIEQQSEEAEFTVTASCLELYNEAVTDLLGSDKGKPLAVRKDERGAFRVDGLTQAPCKSASEALRAMSKALQHRHTRAHALNEYSSRSHCLMTFVFASKEKPKEGAAQGAQGGIRRYGKLVLVDLAGSERLRETGNSAREAVRETGAINKSLFTLGQVLASLAARSARADGGAFGAAPVHVPYRDSKLTQLLWDGLRGSGRALMLACLGPMRNHAEESLNTLHFASVALRIKAKPVVLLDPQDQLVMELRDTIRQLREENRQLATAMAQLSSGADVHAVFEHLPEKLRLAAARDNLASAPGGYAAAGASAGAGAAGGAPAGGSPGIGGAAGAAAPPQTAPGPRGPGGARSSYDVGGKHGAPWRSALEPQTPEGSPHADVFRLSVQGPPGSPGGAYGGYGGYGGGAGGAAARGSSFMPPPINYSYDLAAVSRANQGGGGPRSSAMAGRLMARPQQPVFQTAFGGGGAGAGRRSASVDAAARRGGQGPSYTFVAPPVHVHAGPSPGRGGGGANRPSSTGIYTDLPPRGGGRSSAHSGPGQGNGGRGGRGGGAVPPPSAVIDDFPELAALEAAFQQQLVTKPSGDRGGHHSHGKPGAAGAGAGAAAAAAGGGGMAWGPGDEGGLRDQDPVLAARGSNTGSGYGGSVYSGAGAGAGAGAGGHRGSQGGGGSAAAAGGSQQGQQGQLRSVVQPEAEPEAEPKALHWAERNVWFGADVEMTAFAYQVHDELVGPRGMDASTDEYYDAIEAAVSQRFPDKWAVWQQLAAGGSGGLGPGRGVSPGRSPGGGHGAGQSPNRRAGPAYVSHNFGAGLKVALKDPTPTVVGGGGQAVGPFVPQRRFINTNTQQQQPLAASPHTVVYGNGSSGAGAGGRQAASKAQQQQQQQPVASGAAAQRAALGSRGSSGGSSAAAGPAPGSGPATGQSSPSPSTPLTRPATQLTPPGSSQYTPGEVGAGPEHRRASPSGSSAGKPPPPGSSGNSRGASRGYANGGQKLSAGQSPGTAAMAGGSRGGSTPGGHHRPGSTGSSVVNPFGLAPMQQEQEEAPDSEDQGVSVLPLHLAAARGSAGQGSVASGGAGARGGGGGGGGHARKHHGHRNLLSKVGPVWPDDPGMSWKEMQAEYMAQRQLVLEELRRAKEDAEEERKRILQRIGRTLGASRWRA